MIPKPHATSLRLPAVALCQPNYWLAYARPEPGCTARFRTPMRGGCRLRIVRLKPRRAGRGVGRLRTCPRAEGHWPAQGGANGRSVRWPEASSNAKFMTRVQSTAPAGFGHGAMRAGRSAIPTARSCLRAGLLPARLLNAYGLLAWPICKCTLFHHVQSRILGGA